MGDGCVSTCRSSRSGYGLPRTVRDARPVAPGASGQGVLSDSEVPSGEEVDEHADAEGDAGEHGEDEFDAGP